MLKEYDKIEYKLHRKIDEIRNYLIELILFCHNEEITSFIDVRINESELDSINYIVNTLGTIPSDKRKFHYDYYDDSTITFYFKDVLDLDISIDKTFFELKNAHDKKEYALLNNDEPMVIVYEYYS